MRPRCPRAGEIDAYFGGRSSPAAQRDLRPHLDACPDCRVRFQRHLQLSALDPRVLPLEERLGRALGVRRRRLLPTVGVRGWTAMAGAVAAAAVALLLGPGTNPGDDFRARGGGEPAALVLSLGASGTDVLAFRTDLSEGISLSTGQLPATAELAFAYRNPGGWQWLMVFARDELGNVYWYQPPWTDGRDDPPAVALSGAAGLHELPKAVAHTFRGQRLRLCALASNQPLSVRQVEQQLQTPAPGPLDQLTTAAGGQLACRDLEVLR
jgi:hypothetical protein